MFARALVLVALCLAPLGCDAGKKAVELDDPSAAPEHSDAKRLRFRGQVAAEHVTTWSWVNSGESGPGRPNYRHVVPVVGETWTPADPVPLWVSNRDNKIEDPKRFTTQLADALQAGPIEGPVVDVAGREPGFRKQSGWQKAIELLATRGGPVSDERAPIVSWEPAGQGHIKGHTTFTVRLACGPRPAGRPLCRSDALDAKAYSLDWRVNGEGSMSLNLAFGNGRYPKTWRHLPPGEAIEDRRVGVHIADEPGEYLITLHHLDREVARATLRVSP